MTDILIPVDKLDGFWKRVYENGMTLQNVLDELHDLEMVATNVSHVYDHVTGGMVSKATTDASVVCSLADDFSTKIQEENIAELLDTISSEFDIPIEDLEELQ